jgi:hypothetical protein
MRKYIFVAMGLILSVMTRSEEGMWVPVLLEKLNISRMQDLGLKLSAEDIYSINQSSLKDAIVQFGGGCTAEIVSSRGLILTNHHCGLGSIQKLSSLEHDYLTNGFWARSFEEELPCKGLSVMLLNRMEDVTASVLQGVDGEMSQIQRSQIIRSNMDKLEKDAVTGTHYEARIRPFFYGNQYYLFVFEVFKDIRLVGTPPMSIGKFGGDTDNWMWPRHTGDFSVFRIYAGKDNKPSAYNPENIPYTPRRHLPVSLKGYSEGDFTFVFGYPGTTKEYLSAAGIDLIVNKENPLRIRLRQKRLDIIDAAMARDHAVRIQYTAKAAGIANYWKKMIGESKGILRADAITLKKERESAFISWVEAEKGRAQRYGQVLPSFQTTYHSYLPVDISAIYITEAAMGVEMIRFAAGLRDLVTNSEKSAKKDLNGLLIQESVLRTARDFFKNWNYDIDKEILAEMLGEMYKGMDPGFRPRVIDRLAKKYQGDFGKCADNLFSQSVLTDSGRICNILTTYKEHDAKVLRKDPIYSLMLEIYSDYEKQIQPQVQKFTVKIDSLQRIYMAAQMEMNEGKPLYPDANGTLRVAYGKVERYFPADAVTYHYFTTLEGVMEKEDTSIYDYQVDSTLRLRFIQKDFGQYADKDHSMHVAFIASNHTTGGNSGSPVLNAGGELIGINFDRNWEGTQSDLFYDPSYCRNISLDIRYCLFVIDKVYGNGHLIKEMTVVN